MTAAANVLRIAKIATETAAMPGGWAQVTGFAIVFCLMSTGKDVGIPVALRQQAKKYVTLPQMNA
jgi:hypothetical protein